LQVAQVVAKRGIEFTRHTVAWLAIDRRRNAKVAGSDVAFMLLVVGGFADF